MEEQERTSVLEVSFPKITINVNVVGTNSLLGALCEEFIKRDLIKNVGVLKPEAIVFNIKRAYSDINLIEEINKVRDILKIDEKVISVYLE